LANPVVIPKVVEKLRMCIDYTDLNKACPKDPFPLPWIDQIMDSTTGCDLLCFLDAYSSFHQIAMSKEDEEHTAFITVDGLFCYVSMPYGLKNDLPTIVRAMHKTFGDLIRDLVEVYVDDIIIKIKSHASLLDNLALIFDRLRTTRTKLNPDKCVFGVTTGKLLGFLVSHRGIKANLKTIKTIKALQPPAHIKNVQKLTGCLAALSQFISRLAKRALPFFKLLWKPVPFVWSEEAEEALQELKWYLTSLLIMVSSEPGEPLLLYITTIADVVSMVLVVERPESPPPLAPKGAAASRTGSQDLEPAEKPREGDAVRSHEPKATPTSNPQVGFMSPEDMTGPGDREVVGSQLPEASLSPGR
jgi:hypothetical protein